MRLKTLEVLDDWRYQLTCVLQDGSSEEYVIEAAQDFEGFELNESLEGMFAVDPRAARSILRAVAAFHKTCQSEKLLRSA